MGAPVMDPCQTVQHTTDHTSPAGSAPTVCGSLAIADTLSAVQTRAPADGSASPPVQGQPGGGFDASRARRLVIWHRVSGQGAPAGTLYPAGQSGSRSAAGGAEPLAATAAALFGLSPDSQ